MKNAALGISLLAVAAGAAPGAEEWSDTKARVDEVVADTTFVPAPSALQPLGTRIPFTNFRYPYVDAEQNVTFIADDPLYDGSKGSNHGIYRSYAGSGGLATLVSTRDTPVPGTNSRFRFIRGLHMADNLSDFVFSGISTDGKNGIYLWKDGKLSVIARTGETVIPGDDAPLESVEYASYSGDHLLYTAGSKTGPLLVLCDLSNGKQAVLVRGGQPMPGGAPTDVFRYFSPQNWNDGPQVVFRAARVAEPYDQADGTVTNRGLYGWTAAPGQPIDYGPEKLRKFVDWNTQVPGFPGAAFTNLRSAPIHDDLMTFVGSGAGFRGIYWMNTNGGPLQAIVDTSTSMQGLFKGGFTGFAIYPTIIGRSIVFAATAENYAGIFLYRPDVDDLFLLTDNRSPIEGKKAVNFEIASCCLIGNRLAVKAEFSDKSQGVYLATIPKKAIPRAAAAAAVR